MKIRKLVMITLLFLLIGLAGVYLGLGGGKVSGLDPVSVNDIVQSITEQWDRLAEGELPGLEYGMHYTVLDADGQVAWTTAEHLSTSRSDAIRNRDTILELERDGIALGTLLIDNDQAEGLEQQRGRLIMGTAALLLLVAAFAVVYGIYLDRRIFGPFRKLEDFARHVAAGDLDLPLPMDQGNAFGAFTESFDLMRTELAEAKAGEQLATKSKKELVASLSHDIKTPVASIKAVTEVLLVKAQNEGERKQLQIVNTKADQINTLVSNLFNATLEELQELKVSAVPQTSEILYGLIRSADYSGLTEVSPIPACCILTDPLRLGQVVDNIISNSYKYAGTAIRVHSRLAEAFLEVEFRDYGKGVTEEEIYLLSHKFYRAGNAEGKSGAGLGLYISRYLMEQMEGGIDCENMQDGFLIRLYVKVC